VATALQRPHVWHAREIVMQSGAALRLERWLTRHFAATVIAVSAAVAAQLDGAPVVIEYDEPDHDDFHPGRAGSFRARLGIADDVPLVGAAGRIDTWKGLDVLLDAVPALQAARPDLEVVIAGGVVRGKEDFARRLADRAAGLAGVHWLGERGDMAELIADLDVLVLPSTTAEPFGLAVVEALASGVPVVATAAGGPLEILGVSPDGAGQLVPPGDASRLAAATLELLPAAPSGTAARRARPVLRNATPGDTLAAIFDETLNGARRPPLGRGLRSRRRSDPR
jgi:glycosyltransferase involved in cell wall biosynthesis